MRKMKKKKRNKMDLKKILFKNQQKSKYNHIQRKIKILNKKNFIQILIMKINQYMIHIKMYIIRLLEKINNQMIINKFLNNKRKSIYYKILILNLIIVKT